MTCHIIQDLLPLYCDGLCSEESRRAVEEHIQDCSACRARLEQMQAPEEFSPVPADGQEEVRVLRGVKRKFSRRRRFSVLAVALAALMALAALTAASDMENPIPYQEGTVTARLAGDEAIDLYFDGGRCASFWAFFRETEGGYAIYFCYTRTLKSAVFPLRERGHICIGNAGMTDFATVCYQAPYSQEINEVYYLEASRQDYLRLAQMPEITFAQAAQDAVLLWERGA